MPFRDDEERELAHATQIAFCEDPKCGLHLIPCRADGTAICEIVFSAGKTLDLVNVCKAHLYDKATKK